MESKETKGVIVVDTNNIMEEAADIDTDTVDTL